MSFYERRPKRRNVMKKMTVALGLAEKSNFEGEDLINVLSDITFSLVNINLNMSKSDLEMQGRGSIPVGFVNKFYGDEEGNCMFDVAIFEKFAETVTAMEENGVAIVTKAFTNRDGKITKITSFDLVKAEYATEEE